jgi:hypothetical protein
MGNFLILMVWVLSLTLSCNDSYSKKKKAGKKTLKTKVSYEKLKKKISVKQKNLKKKYKKTQGVVARNSFIKKVEKSLIKDFIDLTVQWYGTVWGFHGTTEIPKKGKIACGYFVSTILKHMGFNVLRGKMGRKASEFIIKDLTSEKHIKRYSNASIKKFVDSIKLWGKGLYVVGLDFHTGFILYNKKGIFFIHSNYSTPKKVIKEKVSFSIPIISSKYRVLGKILSDKKLILKWINRTPIR